MDWIALDCIGLHWMDGWIDGLDCIGLHWTALDGWMDGWIDGLDCIGLHWTALDCIGWMDG